MEGKTTDEKGAKLGIDAMNWTELVNDIRGIKIDLARWTNSFENLTQRIDGIQQEFDTRFKALEDSFRDSLDMT